jgi:hypothetical protein
MDAAVGFGGSTIFATVQGWDLIHLTTVHVKHHQLKDKETSFE